MLNELLKPIYNDFIDVAYNGKELFMDEDLCKPQKQSRKTLSGIDEKNDSNKFIIYPNPTNDNVSISYMLENNIPAQLIITDIVGKQIKNVELVATKQIETIDCKNLSNGIYMIQVVQNKKLLCSERLVINK
jgi:hypothetical protein